MDHAQHFSWLFWTVAAIFGWVVSRQRKGLARRTAAARPTMRPPAAVAAPVVVAAPPARPPYAPPPSPPIVRTFAPRAGIAAPMDAPPARSPASAVLRGAFGDPSHARTAVILSEVLAPPVALR
jgi:hypothetical protein